MRPGAASGMLRKPVSVASIALWKTRPWIERHLERIGWLEVVQQAHPWGDTAEAASRSGIWLNIST